MKSTVSERYFAAAGVPVLAGRAFTAEDRTGRASGRDRQQGDGPSLLGIAAARGRRAALACGRSRSRSSACRETRCAATGKASNPEIYVSSRQRPAASAALIVRSADPSASAPLVRAQIRALDADVPVYQMRPMQQALDEDLSSSHVLGSLFVAFAVLALVLAASGLYAVVSYSASQRVKEIGVRVALGALPSDITRMMLRQTGVLVAIGLALGLAGGRVLAMGATTLLLPGVAVGSRDLRRRRRDPRSDRAAGELRSGAPRHRRRSRQGAEARIGAPGEAPRLSDR